VAAEPSFTSEELQRIEATMLLIIGDRDIVTPEHAVEMFRTIPWRATLCGSERRSRGAAEGDGPDVRAGTGHQREVAARSSGDLRCSQRDLVRQAT
jgi:hypothetical protein